MPLAPPGSLFVYTLYILVSVVELAGDGSIFSWHGRGSVVSLSLLLKEGVIGGGGRRLQP